MKDLSGLQRKIQASAIMPVTQRAGAWVYEARTARGAVFVKGFASRAACDLDCEILEALTEFPLTPNILSRFDWHDMAVVVTSALGGSPLDRLLENCSRTAKISLLSGAGAALGSLQRAIPTERLSAMKFWKNRDGPSNAKSWREYLEAMISKWSTRVNTSALDYTQFTVQLAALPHYCKDLREPAQLELLHCDYTGRNILADSDQRISGILDFETARIGDPVYDLAKMVWVNTDFSDTELRLSFLKGWETTYGEPVPKREFLCYVGVQCLAAIAWLDRNPPLDHSQTFRVSAIRTLCTVVEALEG